MTTFRLPRLSSTLKISAAVLKRPFLLLLFAYFLTSSSDLLHVYALLFKVKLTNALAFLLFSGFILSRFLHIPKKISLLTLSLLTCMLLSFFNSANLIASIGFVLFFIFNYLFYFLIPYNQFRIFSPNLLFKIYSASFYFTGTYAFCQIFFSLFGIIIPGVGQFIGPIARGAAFTYEPSYYALYMTPFAMFCTAKFLLQDPSTRKMKTIFWPNFFLLISTSTGCFFSYLFFLFFLILFKRFRIIDISIKTILRKFFITCLSTLAFLWIVARNLLVVGFLKFFYGTGISHFSVQERWRWLVEYWNVFLEHPLIGVSLGAGPFYIASQKGSGSIDPLDPQILNIYSPMNATTEVLASLGLLGGLCFLIFFYLLINSFRQTLRNPALTSEEKITLISFALSICVMLMTLQFSPSIMRAYMWIHIGLFFGYTNYLRHKTPAFGKCEELSFKKQM